jgi:hypothetical protein
MSAPILPIHQSPNWQMQNRSQRIIAALLALLISLGLVWQLNRQSGARWLSHASEEPIAVMLLQLLPFKQVPLSVPEPVLTKAVAPTRPTKQQSRKNQPITQPLAALETTVSASTLSMEPPVQVEPLSSLRFDREAIAKAYKEGKSEIQKMAEASGKDKIMTIGPPTKSERYQEAIARGYKPDCISPNMAGGLLAIPVIGYMIATDKCNFRK